MTCGISWYQVILHIMTTLVMRIFLIFFISGCVVRFNIFTQDCSAQWSHRKRRNWLRHHIDSQIRMGRQRSSVMNKPRIFLKQVWRKFVSSFIHIRAMTCPLRFIMHSSRVTRMIRENLHPVGRQCCQPLYNLVLLLQAHGPFGQKWRIERLHMRRTPSLPLSSSFVASVPRQSAAAAARSSCGSCGGSLRRRLRSCSQRTLRRSI